MVHEIVVLEWLYKADQDFGLARKILTEGTGGYFDQVCWLSHQAAEKYLKAYIVKFELKFEKQHDLMKLLETCSTHNSELIGLDDACDYLKPFYFEIRYGGDVFVIATEQQAKEALESARLIQEMVRKNLGIEREVIMSDLEKENEAVDNILRSKN
jgi:HEPN domain-containing protein